MSYTLQRRKHKINRQSLIIDILIWVFLILAALFILAPIIFMFTASLMPANDILKMPYRWIPKGFYWQNYWQGIRGNDASFTYIRNILNSLIVASVVSATTVILSALAGFGLAKYYFKGRAVVFMLIMATMMIPFEAIMVASVVSATTVILSALAGFGLAKYYFKGRAVVFMLIMATMMIPFEAIMIPLYLVTTKLGIQDSYAGLIAPFLVNAFGVFLMRQFYITFPDEILDAARIDGASELMIFRTIIL